ncbi:MAG TPA: AAA family ATPase [Planctomycetota bacterium]|nr:AAA family ATPase [Planctomycetota bacterium]
MMRVEFNLVLKYCEALDEFVKVRACSEQDQKRVLDGAAVSNKAAYQREVVKACVFEFNPGLDARVERARHAGGQDLIELLYLLTTEVNPGLEIHQVSMPVAGGEGGKTGAATGMLSGKDRKDESRLQRLMVVDRELKKRVVGQEHAIDVVSRAVKKAGVGLRDQRRPVGAFLFVGHVGVGKTELAKAMTEYLYGSQSRLIRVDCSEYALPHEYAKLIGAPPGYIGHNEGGYLTEAAKELDEFVVLFDEIEKAHSKMHNILLQLLDEGTVTDSKGFKVSFKNALVLMTSNLGVREADQRRSAIGFDAEERAATPFEQMREEINEALKKCFRPEFLNRIDETVVFNTLTRNDSTRIADLMLQDLGRIAERAGVTLKFSPEVKRYVVDAGWRRECGARELKRTIKKLVETPLTDLMLERVIRDGMTVKAKVRQKEIVFETEGRALERPAPASEPSAPLEEEEAPALP